MIDRRDLFCATGDLSTRHNYLLDAVVIYNAYMYEVSTVYTIARP